MLKNETNKKKRYAYISVSRKTEIEVVISLKFTCSTFWQAYNKTKKRYFFLSFLYFFAKIVRLEREVPYLILCRIIDVAISLGHREQARGGFC